VGSGLRLWPTTALPRTVISAPAGARPGPTDRAESCSAFGAFELNRYGAAPLKAPASALLRARWARELFPEPLADAHWENFTPGPCTATAPARSISAMPEGEENGRQQLLKGGEPDPLALCTCSACALKANINRHSRPLRKHVRQPCHANSQRLTAISRPA
jgi:hypothetical protein